MSFAKLREVRSKAGLTQEQFAEQVGVDQATISGLEHGRSPSFETYKKIVRHYPQLADNGKVAK